MERWNSMLIYFVLRFNFKILRPKTSVEIWYLLRTSNKFAFLHKAYFMLSRNSIILCVRNIHFQLTFFQYFPSHFFSACWWVIKFRFYIMSHYLYTHWWGLCILIMLCISVCVWHFLLRQYCLLVFLCNVLNLNIKISFHIVASQRNVADGFN